MNAEGKLRVLAQIANRLNAAEIQWALGASAMLYLNGVADRFDDLDIMVQTDQALRAKDILKSMGAMKTANPAAQYGTKYFFEFVIGGVDVDLAQHPWGGGNSESALGNNELAHGAERFLSNGKTD